MTKCLDDSSCRRNRGLADSAFAAGTRSGFSEIISLPASKPKLLSLLQMGRCRFGAAVGSLRACFGKGKASFDEISMLEMGERRCASPVLLVVGTWQLLGGVRTKTVCLLAGLAVSAALALTLPAITKWTIELLTAADQTSAERITQLRTFALFGAACGFIEILLRAYCRKHLAQISVHVQYRTRARLFASAVRQPLAVVENADPGVVAASLSDERANISDLLFHLCYDGWRALLRLIGSIAILAYVDVTLLIASAVLAPVLYSNHRSWAKLVLPLICEVRKRQNRLNADVGELFHGLRTVHVFNGIGVAVRKYVRSQKQISRLLRTICLRQFREIVWEYLTVCGVIAVLLLGASRVIDGRLSVGELVMFLGYLTLLIGPMEQISRAVTVFSRNAAGLEEILLHQSLSHRRHDSAVASIKKGDCLAGIVRFEGVDFRYRNATRNVLEDVHCEFPPGEIIAISGDSGAGKSTLVRLLLQCYEPTHGRITIAGTDVRSLSTHAYRELFGFVDQEVVLFSGTIAENIAFGAANATREAVSAAAALAACDFIEELPAGLDSRLGEDGIRLSGGQRQRIALARALMMNPRIIVLDEPTSQLDEAAEAKIYENLFDSLRLHDRTVVVITHRPTVVAQADRVLEVRNGRVTTLNRSRVLPLRHCA